MQVPGHGEQADVPQPSVNANGPLSVPRDEQPDRINTQYKNWSVCQVCGRCRARGTIGWLDAPYRFRGQHHGPVFKGSTITSTRIVRCPLHWSEWALRHSIGRSNKNRMLMKAVQEWAATMYWCNPYVEPFPLADWPNPIPRDELWADWENGREPWFPTLEMSLAKNRR